jgi:predicted RNase H-like HicB family nuclease
MNTQTAVVTREGKWWVAEVEPLGYATQAKRLADIREQIADLIETVTGIAPDDVTIEIRLPAEVQAHLAEAAQLREQAATAQHEAAHHAREAARALAREGLSVRDIGTALGVSHQRAQQLKAG